MKEPSHLAGPKATGTLCGAPAAPERQRGHITCPDCKALVAAGMRRESIPLPRRIAGVPWCRRCGMSVGHWPGCPEAGS